MMRTRSFTPVLLALCVGGCQLGLGGEEFIAGGEPGPSAAISLDAAVMSASSEAAGGVAIDGPSATTFVTQPSDPLRDAGTSAASSNAREPDALVDAGTDGASSDTPADADTDADAALASDAAPSEAGDWDASDAQVRDSAAACALLSRCCQSLAVAPPLSIPCYAGIAQADGGESCRGLLANLQDAGICPPG